MNVMNPMDNAHIIKLNHCTFFRGERTILEDVSLAIPRGKVTAIMGPSGCGKTTLLRLMGGQLLPETSGSVLIDNVDITKLDRKELFNVRRRMGMLFQSGALFTDMSVFDNVAFPLREHTNLPESLIKDLVLMKLQAVGLRGARELMPSELSGGMARRAALARAIALDPDVIMYDEPFAGQDPISMGVLVQLIRLLNDALGVTSIVVSHDVHETLSIADYIYIVADAKIVGQGTPEEIKQHSSGWVHQFINGLPDGPVPFHYPAKEYVKDLLGVN